MARADFVMQNKPALPQRRYPAAQFARPRGLWGQIMSLLLQPEQFFRGLKALERTDWHWLWIAALILVLVGLSAVRLDSTTAPAAPAVAFDPTVGGPAPGLSDLGGPPPGIQPGGTDSSAGGASARVTTTWTTALVGASGIVLQWFILALLLSEVTLLRGYAPRLSLNLRVAVWASLPLGLMAALQLVYHAAGGEGGSSGLSGMLTDLPGYTDLSSFSQALLLSLAGQLTLFWLWSLLLIYKGARYSLNGSRWSAALVVIAWALVVVVIPVLTGAVTAPAVSATDVPGMPLEMRPGGPAIDPGLYENPGPEMNVPPAPQDAILVPNAVAPADSASAESDD